MSKKFTLVALGGNQEKIKNNKCKTWNSHSIRQGFNNKKWIFQSGPKPPKKVDKKNGGG